MPHDAVVLHECVGTQADGGLSRRGHPEARKQGGDVAGHTLATEGCA